MPSIIVSRRFGGPLRNRDFRSPTRRAIDSAEQSARNRTHAKMTLVSGDIRFTVPYAPRTSNHVGFANGYSEVARPGRKTLLVRTGPGLWKQQFDLFLGTNDLTRGIGPEFLILRTIAERDAPITIINGPGINATWKITSLSMDAIERNGVNSISRATIAIEMTQTSDLAPAPGPVAAAKPAGPKPAAPPPPAPKPAPVRTHVVSKGESLSLISKKYYGTISRWPELAKANNIRNANLIYPGQKLRIP